MAEKTLDPDELRAKARHHRETAMALADAKRRKMHLVLAKEYDRLAAASEAERRWQSDRRPARA